MSEQNKSIALNAPGKTLRIEPWVTFIDVDGESVFLLREEIVAVDGYERIRSSAVEQCSRMTLRSGAQFYLRGAPGDVHSEIEGA